MWTSLHDVAQVGEVGIDGRLFPPPGTKPTDQDNMFAGDWFPVQVKQMEKAKRPVIGHRPIRGRDGEERPPARFRGGAGLLERRPIRWPLPGRVGAARITGPYWTSASVPAKFCMSNVVETP